MKKFTLYVASLNLKSTMQQEGIMNLLAFGEIATEYGLGLWLPQVPRT